MLAYLHAWPKFDESKGNPKSFIKAVVNNCAGMIIREAESQMRWTGQKEMSLSTIIGGDDSAMEMMDIISGEDTKTARAVLDAQDGRGLFAGRCRCHEGAAPRQGAGIFFRLADTHL